MGQNISRRDILWQGLGLTALAAGFSGAAMTPAPAEEKEKRIDPIDLHAVFVMDTSGSVTSGERDIMAKGISDAIMSKDVQSRFKDHLYYAITFIFFADKAEYSKTFIIKSPADAQKMIDEVIWDPIKNEARATPSVGSGTHMKQGLLAAAKLFHIEEQELGINSDSRSVIVLADDPPDDKEEEIRALTLALGTQYRATVFGIPISAENATVANYFNKNIKTPPGLKYRDSMGFQVALRAGLSRPATKKEQVKPVVEFALSKMGF